MEGGDRIRILVVRTTFLVFFFYFGFDLLPSLKNHGVDEIDDMFEMGRETMVLPFEEKSKFEQGLDGASFG